MSRRAADRLVPYGKQNISGCKKSKTLTAADPECRDWMSNGGPWYWLAAALSVALVGLARRTRQAGECSWRCRWPIGLGLHKARNALASHSHRCAGRSRTHQ